MAVVKDWMTEAAEEIAKVVSSTPKVSAIWIRSEIAQHCPFKPDTAYVEVQAHDCGACMQAAYGVEITNIHTCVVKPDASA